MKKIITIVLFVSVIVVVSFVYTNFLFPNNQTQRYEEIVKNEFSGDLTNWAKSMIGKSVYVKGEKLWIDDDLYVDDFKNQKKLNGKKITDCYTDAENHLVVRLSNKEEIIIGTSSQRVTSNVEKYKVIFYGFDNKVLKKEDVRRGESASPPKIPKIDGYRFYRWSQSYKDVSSDLDILAEYEKDDEAVEIFVQDVKAKPGKKKVDVNVLVRNNPGILGMTLQVKYNNEHLKLVDAKEGNAVKDYLTLTKGKTLESGCRFVLDGMQLPDKIRDGIILSLQFSLKDMKKCGDYEIEISSKEGDVVNGKLLPVYPVIRGGCIRIHKNT